jgi:hypothetical protein
MTKRTYIYLIVILVFTVLAVVGINAMTTDQAEPESLNDSMSLITETPEEGFQLAISLARKGVTETQTDREVLFELREVYTKDPDALIASSHVIAVHFQTVAAANNYWKDK